MKTLISGFVIALVVIGLLWWPLATGIEAVAAGKNLSGELTSQWRQLTSAELTAAAIRTLLAAGLVGLPWTLLAFRMRWLRLWQLGTGVTLLSVMCGAGYMAYDLAQSASAKDGTVWRLIITAFSDNPYSLLALAVSGAVAGVCLWLIVRRTGDSTLIDLDEEWEATEKL